MAYDKLQALTLAFPILAVALAPNTADACPIPYCIDTDFWLDIAPVNAAQIPADGVLVLQGTHEVSADPDDGIATIEVTVTKDGEPIAGALEATSHDDVLVWRPAAPFEPGATLQMTGKISNPKPDFGDPCAALEIVFAADLVIDAEDGVLLDPVEFTGTVETETLPVLSIESIACCQGSGPYTVDTNCLDQAGLSEYQPLCTLTISQGYLTVVLTGAPATTGPTAEQVLYTLKVDGAVHSVARTPSFSVYTDAAFCAVIEAMDLASGAVISSAEQCFGQDLGDVLGPHPLEPADLGCPLEQCEPVTDSRWDPTKCTPLDPEPSPTSSDTMTDPTPDPTSDTTTDTETGTTEPTGSTGGPPESGGSQDGGDEGCACDVAPTGDVGLLVLVGLLGLARRRRVRL